MNFAMKKLGHNCLGLNYHCKTSIIVGLALTNSCKYVWVLLTYLHLAIKNTCLEIMSKNLVHAHRKRTCLRNKFFKNRTD